MNEILLEAADQIEERGLYQSGTASTFNYPECTCVVIAIDDVVVAMNLPFREGTRLRRKVADHLGLAYATDDTETELENVNRVIVKWNDAPERTADEVARVLREVAATE